MKKGAKIESINIRRSRFGYTGIVYSYGYAYAVRYAPDAIITEATHSEKLARTSRGVPSIQRLDGHVPVKERGAVAPLWFMGSFLGSNYVLPLGHSRERAQSLPPSGNESCGGRGLDVTAGRGCVGGCLHRRRHGIEGGVAGFVGSACEPWWPRGAGGRHWPSQVASVLSRRTGALRLPAPESAPGSIAFPFSRRSRGGSPVSCLARRLFLPCPQSQCRCYSFR